MGTKRRLYILMAISILGSLNGCSGDARKEVVVYTSVDQVFSEPILRAFEQKTGIRVKPVYDVEATKTTGLVNRLIAEKGNPKCDVFWNNEVARTIVLKREGILDPYRSPSGEDVPSGFKDKDGTYTGFAARARVLVYNTRLVQGSELPQSIFELAEPKWKNKVALAYPLFGTTATHVAALYVAFGKERTEAYLTALKANGVVILDGNSKVVDVVAAGELPIGFTDTDDVSVALKAGKPVKMIYPDKQGLGTLLIPNSVALIKGGPNPEAGKKLMDYLLSKEVESEIAFSESANMPLRDEVKKPAHIPDFTAIKAMDVDYDLAARKIKESSLFCQALFVR
jgi:iron(III) transport system substrate-binding protein